MSRVVKRLEYSPALDGLRGVCLLGVLLFHAPVHAVSGGFLGVSTFFTLSGYLITGLLLAEWERESRIDFRGFWRRRLRRLVPALWLAVVVILATSRWWIPEASRERLTWDAVSSLVFLSNWRFMSPEYAYSRIFSDPSVLQHSWSLSIEAQYYVLYPLILILALRYGGRRSLGWTTFALVVASSAVSWLSPSGAEAGYRSYYGSDARAAEILVGALLAIVRAEGRLEPYLARPSLVLGGGALGFVFMLCGWIVFTVTSPTLYRGGLLAYAICSALVLIAAVGPASPLRSILSWYPLRWIGQVSYGAYVYHWPIFLFFTAERTGLSRPGLMLLRLAVTFAVSWLSYRLIENRIRYHGLRLGRIAGGTAVAESRRWRPVAIVAASTILVSGLAAAQHPGVLSEIESWLLSRKASGDTRSYSANLSELKVGFYGDSAATTLLPFTGRWLRRRGVNTVPGDLRLGCALVEDLRWLSRNGWGAPRPDCRKWVEAWIKGQEKRPIDVAVIHTGSWDLLDHRFPREEKVRAMGDPVFDRLFRSEVRDAVRRLRANEVSILWVTYPLTRFESDLEEFDEVAASDPARVRRHNQILREVAAEYPKWMRIVEFGEYMESLPVGPYSKEIRGDGVHYTYEGRRMIAEEFLGPVLLDALLEIAIERESWER